MKLFILPYKKGSKSAKALAQALGAKRIKLTNSKFRPGRNKLVINWGSTKRPELPYHLNHPFGVSIAANKLDTLQLLAESLVPVPDFTVDRTTAEGWLNEGHIVVCRTVLSGHSGNGIVLTVPGGGPLVPAPLYTRYIKKTAEFRVHVFNGQVIDVQQKKKRRDVEEVNYQVRNHANGWVYAREGIEVPDQVKSAGINAVAALGLDFGAVDVVWNQHHGAYVLEVNTAPGLEGTTLSKYVEAIKNVNDI